MKVKKRSLTFILGLIFLIFIASFTLGVNYPVTFEFQKKPINNIIVSEFVSIPLKYQLTIKNLLEKRDYFKIFTLLNAMIFPTEGIPIDGGQEKTINFSVYVKNRNPGKYAYTYYIKNSQEDYQDHFAFTIVPGKSAFLIETSESISRESEKIKINITNNLPINYKKLIVKIEGEFVNGQKEIKLGKNEKKTVEFEIDQEKLKNEIAGIKRFKVIISTGNSQDKPIEFEKEILLKEERQILSNETSKFIFIGKKITITRKNEGNTPVKISFEKNFNSIERLFLKSSIKPSQVKNEKGNWSYVFELTLNPGETATVTITINYLWFIILILAVLVIVLVIWIKTNKEVEIVKTAKQIKTNSGNFAIKVTIAIKNKGKHIIRDVAILDYLPLSLKYHEYGLTIPDEVKGNKLYWKIGDIEAGEEKRVSYVAYSKIKFEGKLVLPKAKAKYYDKDKNKKVIESNKASVWISKLI